MNIAVIGGGASGMTAAITAANKLKEHGAVTLFEKKNRIGKKLLATGNGRCNISNVNISLANYHGQNPDFVSYPLEIFGINETRTFFEDIGLLCRETYGGRIYPYCNQASAVLDILRGEIMRRGIITLENHEITRISKSKRFRLDFQQGIEPKYFQRVIVTTGGSAAPSTGSDGSGFELLKNLNHTIIKPSPALTQIKTENKLASAWQGIRVEASVSVEKSCETLATSSGELQFASYGLTGPAIMDISATALSMSQCTISVDFMPDYSLPNLVLILKRRRTNLSHLTLENFLTGFLNKKIGQALCKYIGIEKLSLSVSSLRDDQLSRLASVIKKLEFKVLGHTGWENAQVTSGGALTSQFDSRTMESKIIPGLYAAGEVLDIYGDCGGYNLQWAWSSGYLAGHSAATL